MSEVDHYAIRGGIKGRERLRLLSGIFAASTGRLLDMAGIRAGARCLDAGCGGGDVSLELARRAGPAGHVTGIDLDPDKVRIARDEAVSAGIAVDYRAADITATLPGPFDVAYTRFLLSHLPCPEAALANIRDALNPGGLIVAEDVDFRGHFSHPESMALRRYVDLYTQVVHARGGDANLGPRLPGMLTAAGFTAIQINVINPAALTGAAKLLTPVTMEAIADAVIEDGIAPEAEITALVDVLYTEARDPGILTSLPRIVQCWARKPAAGI